MKKVMCFGTFDTLHRGHEFFLREAKTLGEYLVVAVARDRTVASVKNRKPLNEETVRARNVRQLGIADRVVLGYKDDKLRIIEREKPDVICLGYDQQAFTEHLKENLRQRGLDVEVVRLPSFHPEKYKSSLLRKASSGQGSS